MPEPAVYVMEKMAHGYRRLGRDAGAGFYEYEDDGSITLWSGLKAFERRGAKVPEEDIRDRLLFIQALEAVRCLEEGVVASVGEANRGSIGLCAFPAATGGAVQFINEMGTGRFVERASALAALYGERFLPTARLSELASHGQPVDERYTRRAVPG